MSTDIETALQAAADRKDLPTPELGDKPTADVPDVRAKKPANPLYDVLTALASLRLTVVLFALSIFLVLAGTLAQVDNGIWTVVAKYFRSFFVWIPFQLFFPRPTPDGQHGVSVPGGFPFPGGWLLGSLLLVNLLAAHAVRFKMSWKRSGILVLHFGVIVMMVGELITGLYAVEGQMTIEGGKSSNYLELQQKVELAIVDSSDPQTDDVAVVPGSRLTRKGLIQDANLPFDLEVHRYFVNSALVQQVTPDNLATAGHGTKAIAVEKPEVSGADPEQKVDIPAAYVTFKKKDTGEALGTYLVTQWVTPQELKVDGKTYNIEMRFKRVYKPYTVQLLKFTHELYPGTTTPKDFASDVRLVDPSQNEDLEARIWMNHPLRYEGETFYQQSFLPGDTGTILQVVRNPAWLLPYFSCAIVAFGMILHFGIKLVQFLEQALAKTRAVQMNPVARWLSLGVLPVGALMLIVAARESRWPSVPSDEMRLAYFGALPVQDGGRIKPFDTVARTSLLVITSKQDVKEGDTKDKDGKEKPGKTQPAVKWLLDVMTQRPAADEYPVFRIENDQMLSLLGLKPKSGFRYSVKELREAGKMEQFIRQAARVKNLDPKKYNEFDGRIAEFAKHVERYGEASDIRNLKIIPPASGSTSVEWLSLIDALREEKMSGKPNPAAHALLNTLDAYTTDDAAKFNKSLADYEKEVATLTPKAAGTADFETFFNRFQPFYIATILYVVIFIMACVAFLLACFQERNWSEPLRRAAFWLLVLTLTVHTCGLLARMTIMDRPFVMVTNLYSSAVFIGWGCVVLGLILEIIFRLGIGSLVASVLGFITCIIAHHLAAGGDTLEMMQAVLDTNFWLATHVTTVTLGYVATFVAGFLALVFIPIYIATTLTGNDRNPTVVGLLKTVSVMIYGIIAFATILSFVGTVLGGIWADQSWGRFWGWDPKENGALIIVLWNALILHARWAGLVKQLGVAVLAVGGNIVTAGSWFGVNMLGVGLHSYGFMSGAVYWLFAFWFSQLFFMGAGIGVALFTRHMSASRATPA